MRGGVVYYDGQFDDARLLIHLAMTAADHGAALVNYCPATGLLRDADGYVNGRDGARRGDGRGADDCGADRGECDRAFSRMTIRRMADAEAEPLMVTSQGIHLVFDRCFLKGDTALMVPRTSDGRVLFVIPWHGHAVAGTTDTPVDAPSLEPQALEEEIEFMLETAGRYLTRPPTRADVLAVLCGAAAAGEGRWEGKTSALSRDHVIHVDTSGLLTITGGKWTTYRHMAEDCVDHAITLGRLRDEACTTKNLRIHGYLQDSGSWARIRWRCMARMRRRFATLAHGWPELAVQAASGLAVHCGGGGVGGAGGDGADGGRCAGAAYAGAVSECARGDGDGRAGGASCWQRNWGAMKRGLSAQVAEFRTLAEQYRVVKAEFPTGGGPRWRQAARTLQDHMKKVKPRTKGCEECLKTGDTWVHLRMCLECGHVGCCDSSKNRHARAHFHATQHPLIQSAERGEDWRWCYIDETYL